MVDVKKWFEEYGRKDLQISLAKQRGEDGSEEIQKLIKEKEEIDIAINKLPRLDRIIVEECVIMGEKQSAVAKRLGYERSMVTKRKNKIIKTLNNWLN